MVELSGRRGGKMKKKADKWLFLFLAILFCGLGIGVLVTSGSYAFLGKAMPINEIILEDSFDSHKGDYVSVSVDAAIDAFAETKHTYNFIPIGKDIHYIVWLDDDSMIALAVPNRKSKDIDRIVEETWDAVDKKTSIGSANPIVLNGKLETLGSELTGYYNEVLDYYGIESTSFNIRYFQIDATESRLFIILELLLFFGLGALMSFLFIQEKNSVERAVDLSLTPTKVEKVEETNASESTVEETIDNSKDEQINS